MDEIIKFASYLTGHDEETIKQMYRDWQSSPNVKANPLDCVVSLPKQWQKCPLCNGDGIIATPILGTVNSTHQVCSVCDGRKIILMG